MTETIEYTTRNGKIVECDETITRNKWNRNTIPALMETARDMKAWDKALKLDMQEKGTDERDIFTGARELLMAKMASPITKRKKLVKTLVKSPVKTTIPNTIGTAQINHAITLSFPAFPGWNIVKELRKLPLKWSAKMQSYTAPYSEQLITKLNTVLT